MHPFRAARQRSPPDTHMFCAATGLKMIENQTTTTKNGDSGLFPQLCCSRRSCSLGSWLWWRPSSRLVSGRWGPAGRRRPTTHRWRCNDSRIPEYQPDGEAGERLYLHSLQFSSQNINNLNKISQPTVMIGNFIFSKSSRSSNVCWKVMILMIVTVGWQILTVKPTPMKMQIIPMVMYAQQRLRGSALPTEDLPKARRKQIWWVKVFRARFDRLLFAYIT